MKNLTKINKPLIAVGLLVAIVVGYKFVTYDSMPRAEASSEHRLKKLPNFSEIADVKTKKQTFFETMYPIIEEENQHVLKLRKLIIKLKALPIEELTNGQKTWISKIAKYYRIKTEKIDSAMFDELLKRVDFVPPSLALTQAAIESGWGTSRFSRQANNIFGQWCFTKGCGVVPSSRDAGKTHEVAKFASVNNAVRAYIRNLNTNDSYSSLRDERARLRQKGEAITGVALAQTLIKYSEEGTHYIAKVTKFINQNKLQRFNTQFEKSITVAGN